MSLCSDLNKICGMNKTPALIKAKESSRHRKWISDTYHDKFIENFPEIKQNSDKYRELKYNCAMKLEHLSKSETFTGGGQALVDWTQPTSPLSGPLEDNTELREELGLRRPTKEELSIAEEVANLIISSGSYGYVHMRRVSQSGYPHFVPGIPYKRAAFESTLRNLSEITDLLFHENYEDLVEKFGFFPCFAVGVRVQCDRVKIENGLPTTKDRYAYPKEYYTSSNTGKVSLKPITKEVFNESGQRDARFVGGRARAMYSFTYELNCILQIIQNFLYNGLVKVSSVNQYNGEVDLGRQIKEFRGEDIVTLDKAQFDTTMSSDLLEVLVKALERKMGMVGVFVRRTIDAPTLVRSLEKGANDPFFTRAHVKKSSELSLKGSYKSGHGLVSIVGKYLGLLDMIFELKTLYGQSFNLRKFLKNTDPRFFCKNSGDDSLFVFKRGSDAQKLKNQKRVGIHKDEIEEKPLFLGWYYKPDGSYYKDLAKLVESMTGAERSWKLKKNFWFGVLCRLMQYSSLPEFGAVFEIIHLEYLKFYGLDLRKEIDKIPTGELNSATLEFANKPDVIFYKYDPSMIPESLLKEEFVLVDPHEYVSYFEKII